MVAAICSTGLFSNLLQDGILAPHIPRIVSSMKQVVHNANLTVYDISEIVPIGCTAIISALQTHLSDHFPSTPRIHKVIPPQDVIAYGLSKILETYLDTGTIIGNYETSIQSLGVRTAGDLATSIIPRVSILPVQRSRIFTTVKDNQERAIIEIYEGDRNTVGNNTVLGRIEVEDIPPARRGVPKVCLLSFCVSDLLKSKLTVVLLLAPTLFVNGVQIEVTIKLSASLTNPYASLPHIRFFDHYFFVDWKLREN